MTMKDLTPDIVAELRKLWAELQPGSPNFGTSVREVSEILKRTIDEIPPLRDENKKLRDIITFCYSIAAEEYDHQMHNVGAECALRHIMRKCKEGVAV